MYQFITSNSLLNRLAIYGHIKPQSSCLDEFPSECGYLLAQPHAGRSDPSNSRWSEHSSCSPNRVWQDRGCSTSGSGLVGQTEEGWHKGGIHHAPARVEQGHDRPHSTSRRHNETYSRGSTWRHTLIRTAQAGREPARHIGYHSGNAPSNPSRKSNAASSQSSSFRNCR